MTKEDRAISSRRKRRNKTEKRKAGKSKLKSKPPLPPSKTKSKALPPPEEIKQRFQVAQLNLLVRSMKPVDFDNALATKEDLVSYQARLLHMNLQKELHSNDLQAQNQGIRNLRELIIGIEEKPGINVNDIIVQFIQAIKDPMLKNGLIAYARQQAQLATSSKPA